MNTLSRRTFLRGIGTTIALPTLEAMIPTSALAMSPKAAPVRMAFLFVPNGIDMDNWRPSQTGSNFDLPHILEPLKGMKGMLNVVSGLSQNNAAALGDGPGDHARSTATWLTGVHIKKTAGADIRAGISVDQVAAQVLGKETRFASLEIGCERGAMNGDCDSGYSCSYSSNISWRGESTPVAKEVNPRLVFERLFGSSKTPDESISSEHRKLYRRSILDFIAEDADALRSQLGLRDQQKVAEYLDGVRDIERRLEKAEAENQALSLDGIQAPKGGVPKDRGEHIRLLGDMMVLAFQADLTRICTFMFANDGSNRPYPEIGIGSGHHEVSHHGKDPSKLKAKRDIDRFHLEQLAYVLNRMASIKEPSGTLLENSMIVYGAGISDGDRHNHDDLPILIAGRAGGKLPSGRHVVYPNGTPMTNLFVTMLDRFGVPIERLGDSNGRLRELF